MHTVRYDGPARPAGNAQVGQVGHVVRGGARGHAVLAVAHRGGAGRRTENTLAAFRWSYGLGVRWLETDVRATRDGVPVLHHDRTLRRLFGVGARVRDLMWDDLRSLRTAGGDRVLRPVDVLQDLPEARLTIDVKEAKALPGLLRELRRAGAVERVCLAGAPDEVLDAAVRAEPRLHRALGWRSLVRVVGEARLGVPTQRTVLPPRAGWAHVPDRLLGHGVLTAGVVEHARQLGLRVLAWTVDDPRRMAELCDLGVAGIITDRPDLLRDVLLARGAWVPPPPSVRGPSPLPPTLPRWTTVPT